MKHLSIWHPSNALKRSFWGKNDRYAVDGWAVVITTEGDGEKNLKNNRIICFSGEQ